VRQEQAVVSNLSACFAPRDKINKMVAKICSPQYWQIPKLKLLWVEMGGIAVSIVWNVATGMDNQTLKALLDERQS
jgi:hypothetical protein